MIELELIGGARTVTGSKHLVRTSRATVLLECGLFQGHRDDANRRNRELPIDAARLDAVVLSHAHLDHSGALPVLARHGYGGPIYATPATCDLCRPMLLDAATIQDADARHIARLVARGVAIEPVTALYTRDDVETALRLMTSVPYHVTRPIAPGISLTLFDAGHVLGSAIVVLDIEDGGDRARLVFTGDLGRPGMPILRDPEVPDGATCLLSESTYGDRVHPPIAASHDALASAIRRASARGGKIIIPTFALERAQEVILALRHLRETDAIPKLPVYVDSPLATELTDVFRRHPECYDDETAALLRDGSPFALDGLEYVTDVERSKAIDARSGSAVILAGSGMCEGGRVLHHLLANVADARACIALVGYQAEHTLGRRIAERRPQVKIFGVMRELHAEVVSLDGFSAHADQRDLVAFAEAVRARGPLRDVVLVHGEPPAQTALAARLAARGFRRVVAPAPGDRLAIADADGYLASATA